MTLGRLRRDRVGGGIFEREERVGEVIEGVGDADGPCLGDKNMMATIVKERRGDVAGKLSQLHLVSLLAQSGFLETQTPCLFHHLIRPIAIVLVVDDFGVK
jgi:hypothetical protein